MGIRDWTNRNPRTVSGVVGAVVVVALASIVVQVMATRHRAPTSSPSIYYSDDDGKTFFAASSDLVPPFDHDGQPAVRAYVFSCSSGKSFVGYLERYTPAAHDAIAAGHRTADVERFGRELKRPGDATWVKSGNLAIENKITNITCPDGGTLELVEP
jgi:hypothetical protein